MGFAILDHSLVFLSEFVLPAKLVFPYEASKWKLMEANHCIHFKNNTLFRSLFIHLLIHSFIYSFIYLFIHLFIYSLIYLCIIQNINQRYLANEKVNKCCSSERSCLGNHAVVASRLSVFLLTQKWVAFSYLERFF